MYSSDRQPNPDEILERINRHNDASRRGRLKVFLGAAPGVGKTYAMLSAAHELVAQGTDVVAGYVENHGRLETQNKLNGLEILPPRKINHGDLQLVEFDLDRALQRRPEVILVDELAHTNAPGSRHAKRYADVIELLDAGIDVLTTVNVQHLESVSSTVQRISGVRVRETVPDSVLKRADVIELIDLPPDELQDRLRAGKVYRPEVAERALKNFFAEGNLIALREIALRQAAHRVEDDLHEYRRLHAVTDTWPAAEKLLVCVGPSPLSGKVVRTTHRMSESLRADWVAVTVDQPTVSRRSNEARARALEHLRLASALGAETQNLSGESVATEILNFARERNVTMIVIGKPTHRRWKDRILGSLVDDIIRKSGSIEIHVVTGETEPRREKTPSMSPLSWGQLGLDITLALAVAAVCTVIARLVGPHVTTSDQVMIFLTGVLLVAYRASFRAANLTALVCVGCFNFFFIRPLYTFVVTDAKYILTFGTMGVLGVLVSSLVWRVRVQTATAKLRHQTNARLFKLTRALANQNSVEGIASTAASQLKEALGADATIFVGEDAHTLEAIASEGAPLAERSEAIAARWVFKHQSPAGIGTDTLPGVAGHYIPLTGKEGSLGVVGLRAKGHRPFTDPEERDLLENMVAQTSQSLERLKLSTRSQQARISLETEQLRNSLLSSISHDIRTPVAGIIGSSELLKDHVNEISITRQAELVDSIYTEARRLQTLVEDILQITRIEGRGLNLNRSWHLLEELVGAALQDAKPLLNEYSVETELDPSLVYLDSTSVTTALRNLIENALKFSPKGSVVLIRGERLDGLVRIAVFDQGTGIDADEADLLFEKFARGKNATGVPGSGLGLAIVAATASAHGGHTFARNRVDGVGSEIGFTISQKDAPQLPTIELDEN